MHYKLEKVMNRVAREEGLDTPKLMQQVILLLLFANDVVIFSYNVDGMQCLLRTLEAFFQSSGLIINVDETKMMTM